MVLYVAGVREIGKLYRPLKVAGREKARLRVARVWGLVSSCQNKCSFGVGGWLVFEIAWDITAGLAR